MYQIIKDVIVLGTYDLNDMLKKINTVWIQGDITEEEKTELIKLAQDNAKPENSYKPLQEQIDNAFKRIEELEARIVALEGGEEPTPEEYPQYKQPSGAHDAYNTGDKVTYNGKKYKCLTDGCVWSPDDYPQGWELVE